MYHKSKSIMIQHLIQRLVQLLTSRRIALVGLIILTLGMLASFLLVQGHDAPVLNPRGVISAQQKDLIVFTSFLGLAVIIPVYILLFLFAWKYRETNTKATYKPNEDGHRLLEAVWWGIPLIIITILGMITWKTTHELDPYKPLESDVKPLKIRVVALQWKWLFLYPDQHVASVNEVRFPEKTPLAFELTADAPMSGFWIPALGTQTYAMNGMSSKLSLQANDTGEYLGTNTNISGRDYSKMRFKAISMPDATFKQWAKGAAQSPNVLDWEAYQALAAPGTSEVIYFGLHDAELYNKILAKYMDHGGSMPHKHPTTEHGGSGENHESAHGESH